MRCKTSSPECAILNGRLFATYWLTVNVTPPSTPPERKGVNVADTVLQILERARIGNWTMGQLAEECIKDGMERAAGICEKVNLHNERDQLKNSDPRMTCAKAIRSAKGKL